jgi:hypothetical protein
MRQSCKLEDRNTTLDDGKKGVNSRTWPFPDTIDDSSHIIEQTTQVLLSPWCVIFGHGPDWHLKLNCVLRECCRCVQVHIVPKIIILYSYIFLKCLFCQWSGADPGSGERGGARRFTLKKSTVNFKDFLRPLGSAYGDE